MRRSLPSGVSRMKYSTTRLSEIWRLGRIIAPYRTRIGARLNGSQPINSASRKRKYIAFYSTEGIEIEQVVKNATKSICIFLVLNLIANAFFVCHNFFNFIWLNLLFSKSGAKVLLFSDMTKLFDRNLTISVILRSRLYKITLIAK